MSQFEDAKAVVVNLSVSFAKDLSIKMFTSNFALINQQHKKTITCNLQMFESIITSYHQDWLIETLTNFIAETRHPIIAKANLHDNSHESPPKSQTCISISVSF